MTKDEAIYVLKNTAWLGWDKQKEKVAEAVRMAVEALKRETSGDAISRRNTIDAFMEILDRPKHAEFLYTDEICKVLNELPSVQPDIIACGDCKHYIPHDKRCGYWNHGVQPLMWCSQAERRWKE